MFNNIGLPGLVLVSLIVVLPIWLISRASRRKSAERKRIADALEEIAKSNKTQR